MLWQNKSKAGFRAELVSPYITASFLRLQHIGAL